MIGTLSVMYGVIMTAFTNSFGYSIVTAVTAFYLALFFLHFAPISTFSDSTGGFYRLLRSVMWPMGSVTFSEVLLADALTSISKVLKDFGTYLVVLYATMQGRNIIDYHDNAMLLVAIFASIPFM